MAERDLKLANLTANSFFTAHTASDPCRPSLMALLSASTRAWTNAWAAHVTPGSLATQAVPVSVVTLHAGPSTTLEELLKKKKAAAKMLGPRDELWVRHSGILVLYYQPAVLDVLCSQRRRS